MTARDDYERAIKAYDFGCAELSEKYEQCECGDARYEDADDYRNYELADRKDDAIAAARAYIAELEGGRS